MAWVPKSNTSPSVDRRDRNRRAPGWRSATGAGRSGRRGDVLGEPSVEAGHRLGGFRPRRQGQGQLPDRRGAGPGSQQLLDGAGVITGMDRPALTLIQTGAVPAGAAGRDRADDPPAELQRGDQDPAGIQPPLTSRPGTIIVQPTSLCPFACTYCYLPQRHLKRDMSPTVAAAVAASIEPGWPPVEAVWHGGEPLAVGPRRLAALLEPFEPLRRAGRVRHKVQTGATLITDAWCELFERYEIGVGVSIDGPRQANRHRVDRAGRPLFDRIVAGIETLKRHGIPFIVLAVVSRDSTHQAVEVLDFLRDLGCQWVGFNIEAKEGANALGDTPALEDARRFWRDTFAWCRQNRDVTVREVQRLLGFLGLEPAVRAADAAHDLFPRSRGMVMSCCSRRNCSASPTRRTTISSPETS